jgi:glycosyltransferase involved in cell wall biosynthesis
MHRVVHVAIDHLALDVRVFAKEARTLAAAGYDVHIVTTRGPGTRDGVQFHDIHTGGARRPASGLARRLVDRVERLWRTYRVARALQADVYHLHEPLLIPLGLLLRRGGARVLFDAHEDFELVAARFARAGRGAVWLRRFAYRLLALMARRNFDGVIAATPSILARYPGVRTALVRNFPELRELHVPDATEYRGREAVVAYVGGISRARGLSEMLDAIEQVPNGLGASLHVAGRFMPAALEREAQSRPGWARTTFHGWLDRDAIAILLAQARVGLLILHPDANHIESLPIKLFEYMAAGIPVIASDFPLWRSIIGEAGCGLLVDPLDVAATARALVWLLEHPADAEAMGDRGRKAVRERFNWSTEGTVLRDLYEELAA